MSGESHDNQCNLYNKKLQNTDIHFSETSNIFVMLPASFECTVKRNMDSRKHAF